MLVPMDLNPKWKRLGWAALAKLVVAGAGAIGAKLGEKLVESVFKGPDDDEDEDDEDDDGEGPT